ncbi:hypothetical protein [Mesorhizobium captivum]|uniref:hypothetical protein n=1 Tax=Mesorhizobium captivum TaxID=3072319 RepID=UPI002A2466C6|nr:hypothetical protein [Mesorhizobium sp. VK3C]MDX8446042.1 hypothetical protein [Mesorhizobium sp. VK3C]
MTQPEERKEPRRAKVGALREEIRKGVESGASIPASEVLDRLEAKYRRPMRQLISPLAGEMSGRTEGGGKDRRRSR